MKKLIMLITLSIALVLPATAQNNVNIKKEMKTKAVKQARKEAKKIAKDGFRVSPGQLPMDKQIENVWTKRYETDNEGRPAFYIADAKAVGETHSAAKMQAYEIAKINLANQIGTEVAGLIETKLGNTQLNATDAASVTESVATFKSLAGSKMGRTLTLFEASRNIGKNTEVMVTLGYSYKTAMEVAKSMLRKDMKEKAKLNSEQLDKILDF
ncbi:MAG: hypothetical protein JXR71_01410 [Bacteroidales bacterium]|nr:hypothetical protein [Bacteroidales bacterium]